MGDFDVKPYVQANANTNYGVGAEAGVNLSYKKLDAKAGLGTYSNEPLLFSGELNYTQPVSDKWAIKAGAYADVALAKDKYSIEYKFQNGDIGEDIYKMNLETRPYKAGARIGAEFKPAENLKLTGGVSYANSNPVKINTYFNDGDFGSKYSVQNKNRVGAHLGADYSCKNWNFGINGDTAKQELGASVRYTF